MPALKLKSLVLRNWATIRSAELEFPERGLVLVVGDNQASGGFMQSVGTGKTSLGEGLCRALLGCDARSSDVISYSTNRKGNTFVRVRAEILKKPLVVELGYKCPEFDNKGEALRYTFDGNTVQRSKLKETREELSKIVGVDADVAQWTVLVDGERVRFSQISQENSVGLLMRILRQPPWTDYHERARQVVSTLRVDHESAVNTRARLEKTLAEMNELIQEAEDDITNSREAFQKRIQKQKETVAKAREDLADIQKEIKDVETRRTEIKQTIEELIAADAERHHQIEISINELRDRRLALENDRIVLIEKRSDAAAAVEKVSDLLDDMRAEPDNCPKCGKKWDKKHSEEELAEGIRRVEEAQEKHRTACEHFEAKRKQIATVDEQITARREELKSLSTARVTTLSKEDAGLEEELRTLNKERQDYELELVRLETPLVDTRTTQAEATLKERREAVRRSENGLKAAAAEIVEAAESLKVSQYWFAAFGPTGIPNMILEEAIKPLNEVSTALSKRMTGGCLAVSYSTKRTLAKGTTKAELVMQVDNKFGSNEIKMNSKGEGGLTNLFISETLSEIGSMGTRIGFRWYDEVVPHQDGVLSRAIYGYMRELAHTHDMLIFLVDHNPVAENFADHVLVLEKQAAGSRVYWR